MKIKETFIYEVEDCNDINEVFTIQDYIDCVDVITTPIREEQYVGTIIDSDLEILEK